MVPEFDAVAMSLKEGEVSQVFKTQYGWHFMQLIERRGEHYNARHVLMRPQVAPSDLAAQRDFLDSLRSAIAQGRTTFEDAAREFSDDEDSRGNNGTMIEPNSNSIRWGLSALDQQSFFVLDRLKPGEVSEPQLLILPDGSKAYRLLRLQHRTEPHRANLRDDYRLIQQVAEGRKRADAVEKWTRDHIRSAYIRIDPDYIGCRFTHPWVQAAQGQ
jgi:peptidyl-prolyl cis-trans isomerase SurA